MNLPRVSQSPRAPQGVSNPSFGGLGFLPRSLTRLPMTLCGACAIAGFLAPQWMETVLPGYHSRYAPFVALIIGWALLRAVFLLLGSLTRLAFFGLAGVAMLLTLFPSMRPTSFTLPNVGITGSSSTLPTPSSISAYSPAASPKYKSLPPALPDEAYFPKRGAESGTNAPLGGVMKLAKGFLR